MFYYDHVLMTFHWHNTAKPIVALAPMAGVTDASYRQLIKSIAPEVIVYTEFLSTDAIHYGAQKTMGMLHFDPAKEHPFIVQVFGKDPEHFLSAAKVIEEMGADGIDINMGCPAAKVVSSCHGSALIKNADLAKRLVEATKKAVSIPVSVKTRLGWDCTDDLIPFCQGLVDAGADALAIHGRTYEGKFGGDADWNPIYELKNNVTVPVLGNGDIATAQDAVAKIGNLDGVMVGRGTFGNPWLMKDIVDALEGRIPSAKFPVQSSQCKVPSSQFPVQSAQCKVPSSQFPVPSCQSTVDFLSFEEKIPIILEHCTLAVQTKGLKRGMFEMRKHLAHYVKGIDGAKELRSRLVQVESVDEVKQILCK
jgi:tRNA-dihydrouridine synthase B